MFTLGMLIVFRASGYMSCVAFWILFAPLFEVSLVGVFSLFLGCSCLLVKLVASGLYFLGVVFSILQRMPPCRFCKNRKKRFCNSGFFHWCCSWWPSSIGGGPKKYTSSQVLYKSLSLHITSQCRISIELPWGMWHFQDVHKHVDINHLSIILNIQSAIESTWLPSIH